MSCLRGQELSAPARSWLSGPQERRWGGSLARMREQLLISLVREHRLQAKSLTELAAVHNAMITFARRLAQTAFNKLARTFAAQVEALKNYRSKGERRMVVQHVIVAEVGQAIAPAPGVGPIEKAPGIEMPREIEAERATVSSDSAAWA